MPLNGFVIDIMRNAGRADELLIEIQTSSFASMGNKLDRLLAEHRIHLVHPIAVRTRIERPELEPRWSPKRGSVYSLFDELVSMPTLLDHPSLTLDVVLVEVVKSQVHDPALRRRRGGYRTVDRRLERIVETHSFGGVDDLVSLLPDGLPPRFTTKDLSTLGGFSRDAAQKLAYCFKAACLFDQIERTRAGYVYRISH